MWIHDGEEDTEDTTTKEMFEAIDSDKAVLQKRGLEESDAKKGKKKKSKKKKKSTSSSSTASTSSKSSSSSSTKAL